MIGSVRMEMYGVSATATLDEDATWSFAGDTLLAGHLRHAAALVRIDDRGPADGPFGPRQLAQVAARVKGTVHLESLPAEPAGTIY